MIKMKPSILAISLTLGLILSVGLAGCMPGGGTSGSAGTGQTGPNASISGDTNGVSSSAIVTEWALPIIISITGPDSEAGLAAAWGFDYGVKAVNELGGIRGQPAKITIRDAASTNLGVSSEIEYAAADALIALGPADEGLYRAGEETFFSAGMPVVGAATDKSNRESYHPFAISCISVPGSEAVSAVEAWMLVERFTQVCMMYLPIYGERTGMAEAAFLGSGRGITITEKIEITGERFDAATVAENAFESGADAFYIDAGGEDALRIVRQLRALAGENAAKLKILLGPQAADKELIESDEEGELVGVRVWAVLDPTKDTERRKLFNEAYEKNLDNPLYYNIAVDYYQSALMLRQAIDTLGLTGRPDALAKEREVLAAYLYDSDLITTDQGDFYIVSGSKQTASKLYRVSDKGFQ